MISEIYLLNVPFTDLSNVLYFANDNDRFNYFYNRRIKDALTNFSYIRKDNILKVPFEYDDIIMCNYIMYKNSNYNDRWFYSFVVDKKYENDACTSLTLKEDSYQTWISKVNFYDSFIEREHVTDDTIGKHTIDENLDVGEIEVVEMTQDTDYITSYIIVSSNYNPYTGVRYSGAGMHQGYISGSVWFAFNMRTELAELSNFIHECDNKGHADDIQEIFAVPNTIITYDMIGDNHIVNNSSIGTNISKDISINKNFSSYNVKNNKCKCYPYQFLYVSNNSGGSKVYKYEDFSTNTCNFVKYQLACNGCSIKLKPKNYKNNYGMEEALMLGKFPSFSWSSDSYTNWLTQNSLNIGISGITSAINSIQTNNVSNALVNTANTIGSLREASMLPNSAKGNVNGGDVNFITSELTFVFYNMSAKDEYLRIIDNYFTKFGYKVNIIKKPQFNTRKYFNYIKTIDINIDGNIPNEAIKEIKNMFNNGVTLWNKPAYMYDYSVNNTIN